jgi:hypothetical protein
MSTEKSSELFSTRLNFVALLMVIVVANDIAIIEKTRPNTLKKFIRPNEDIERKVGLKALEFDPNKMHQSYLYGRETAEKYFKDV